MRRIAISVLALAVFAVAGGVVRASQPGPENIPGFTLEQVMIPMRDGVRLGTVIARPNTEARVPIILMRTKFAIDQPDSMARQLRTMWRELAEDGYIFVLQNVRGRFRSEGQYVLYQGVRDKSVAGSTDDSTDAYDTIEWLVRNVAGNNGRVGIMGGSQPGTTAAMALLDPHPALKAASPQAPALNHFIGDDFFHNGAFSLAPTYEYAQWSNWAEKSPIPPTRDLVGYDDSDLFDFFLALTPIERVNSHKFGNRFWIWDELIAHPTLDAYWEPRQLDKLIRRTSVPTLIVGGWFDVQDAYGPIALYRGLAANDSRGLVHLVMGPWLHNEWFRAADGGRRVHSFDFGSATAEYYRRNLLAPFFARHLKQQQDAPRLARAVMFQTGSNRWRHYEQFPPDKSRKLQLYFAAGGRLTFDQAPIEDVAFDTYIADPRNPVPHGPRPLPKYYSDPGQLWRMEDQRFAHRRPDTLSYHTEVLDEDVVLTGNITVTLHAATSGTDADWVVKLIDVYPPDAGERGHAGYQYLLSAEIFRGKFSKGFHAPQPLVPGEAQEFTIDLLQRDHVFRRGHRIMVQVQSSWFPLFDVNPGTFTNIMQARPEEFKVTRQEIHRSARRPSMIELDVAP